MSKKKFPKKNVTAICDVYWFALKKTSAIGDVYLFGCRHFKLRLSAMAGLDYGIIIFLCFLNVNVHFSLFQSELSFYAYDLMFRISSKTNLLRMLSVQITAVLFLVGCILISSSNPIQILKAYFHQEINNSMFLNDLP